MYLGAATCISFQDTFHTDNLPKDRDRLWNLLTEINAETQLIQPNYKEYVKPAMLRRMSSALKMGVAGGTECLRRSGLENADAISVGTGLGCVRDTLKFLKALYEEKESTLSPTAFIQSTHNSIAGQLALMLGNHGYNMTHVQGALSLGYALSDAELLIAENDAETVLVGAVDEKTDELVELLSELSATANYKLPRVGEGAAFFLASNERLPSSVAKMVGLGMNAQLLSWKEPALSLSKGGVGGGQPDLLLTNTSSGFNYTQFSGEHFTSVGFGLFLGLKALEMGSIDCAYLKMPEVNTVEIRHSLFGQEMSILLEKA